jgi:queuine tRNA-ribosyltransferase
MIRFAIEATQGAARAGRMDTPRGAVETPMFMPVGTQGTVKAMTPEELEGLGTQIVLANTYHLHLRPGEDVVRRLGGLHRFMHWERPILTDSGGFQVFSLARLSRVSEEGVRFQSHLDGTALTLTPEGAVAIQEALGSDIGMCLDRLVALPADEPDLRAACALTARWAARCKTARRGQGALFGIVQGGLLPALRRESAEALRAIGFDGYAIGGLGVGEPGPATHETVAFTAPLLPADQPRYLMGAGEPADLLAAIGAGVDLFDCVLPTRNARNGTLYTRRGKVNIKQARYREDPAPLEEGCPCPACRHYSRGYLSHLYRAGEILSMRLNTWHNLTFYLGLVREARAAIVAGRYAAWAGAFLAAFAGGAE